jgi:hypothetical protein
MDLNDRRSALQTFHKLGWRTRSEVRRCARDGEQHPDPAVRAAAVAWARVIVATTRPLPPARGPFRRLLGALGLGAVAVAGQGIVPAGGGDDGLSSNAGDRRTALAVLVAAGEPVPAA